MNEELESFLEEYEEIRARTIEFLKTVPQEQWTWKPHELLGSFGMQARHMSTSQQCYIKGIQQGKIDFTQKSFDKEIETVKKKAIERLQELDKKLRKVLEEINDPTKEIIFVDGVTGTTKEELKDVIRYLIDHEYYHQGIFTAYGRLAGLGKFLFM